MSTTALLSLCVNVKSGQSFREALNGLDVFWEGLCHRLTLYPICLNPFADYAVVQRPGTYAYVHALRYPPTYVHTLRTLPRTYVCM